MKVNKMGIDIVSGCQLRCIGCPNSVIRKKPDFMDAQTLETCLSNIDVKINLLRLFNFGEALLHPRFVEMVQLINSWGGYEKLEISTNGQWSIKTVLSLCEVEECIDRLVISVDGDGTPQDYERIRKGAEWEQLCIFLYNIKSNLSSKVELLIRSIAVDNESKKRWMNNLKGFNISFRNWIPMPRSAENPSGRTDFKSKGSCEHVDTDNLYIDWDGKVGPCCNYPNAFYIGNLMNQKASYLVERKRQLRESMKVQRWAVCRECVL